MRRILFFLVTILAIPLGSCLNAGAKYKSIVETADPVAALSADSSTVHSYGLHLSLNLGLTEISSYDYAKCFESCDNQYSACTKNADAEKIKYCSNQHDQCRKACLEHK